MPTPDVIAARRSPSTGLAVLSILCILSGAAFAQPGRIPGRIDPNRRVVLRGFTTPRARAELDRGAVEPAIRLSSLSLVLNRTATQQADLERFLEDQLSPSSPDYHNWLTPEQFADRFSLSADDFEKVTAWLTSEGFAVDYAGRARNWILFSGSAAQVESTFQTRMRRYLFDGEMRYANAWEPSVPDAIAPLIAYLSLNDFPVTGRKPRPRPVARFGGTPGAPLANLNDGSHVVVPEDLATIYNVNALYQMGLDGSGIKMAIVGVSDIHMSDMQDFRTQFGLPQNDPQVILVPGSTDPGYNDAEGEADLDLQYAGGMAPKATLLYVNSTNPVNSALYAVQQNLAPIISMSFGGCEQLITAQPMQFADAYRQLAQQANAQGITWMVSSGDSGAAGCDQGGPTLAVNGLDVNVLASVPEVTGVGGTMFNEGNGNYWSPTGNSDYSSALSYIPEAAWNDTAVMGALWSSGGGVSAYYSKPSWQIGAGVPNDGHRDVPDVSLSASGHDAYYVMTQGKFGGVMGTSASCPAFAGMVALLNQYLLSTGKITKPGLSNINPNLYHLAAVNPGVYHDVTVGTNIVPCKTGTKDCTTGQIGYRAGPGYDLVTGWGSVDAYKLITGWNATSVTSTTTTVSANPTSFATTASTVVTATVKAASGTLSPGGSVTFSAGGSTLGAGTLTGSGGTSTAKITVDGSQLSTGSNSIGASYGGSSGFGSSNGSVTVTVTAPTGGPTTTTLTANPGSMASTGTTTLTATVKAGSGTTSPAGSVAFMLGNVTLGTADLSGAGGTATASFTVNGSRLAAGTNSLSAVYAGSGGFGGSVGTANITVTVPATTTSMSVTATPAGIASAGNTVIAATVRANSGTASPNGSVSFTLGGAALGSASLTGSGGSATASVTVNGSQLAAGNNTITASYGGSGGFAASTGTVTVTVGAGVSNTTTSVAANPGTITTNSATTLTASVTAAGGTPGGQVTFVVGSVTLGAATLAGSGATATGSLTVAGSRLSVGTNTITAFYGGGSGFNGSSGTVNVTVSIPSGGSAVIASVVPNPVYQQAADADGYSWFYTIRLSEIGGVATTLTGFTIDSADYTGNIEAWFGSSNLPAHGTLSASLRTKGLTNLPVNRVYTFKGVDGSGAQWTQQISVPFMSQQIAASMLVTSSPATVAPTPTSSSGCDSGYDFYHELNLQERNGYEVRLTKLVAGGFDLTENIPDWFGSWRLAPLGTLQADICWSLDTVPETIDYQIEGIDTSGHKITATASIAFNPAPAQSGGALSSSVKTVNLAVATVKESASTALGVVIAAGQQWSATLFPANQKSSWLVVSPQSGTGPATITLAASAAGLATGVYTATLVLQSPNTLPQFVNVPITFIIGGSSSVVISGISNTFSGGAAFAPGMLLTVYGTNLSGSSQPEAGSPLPTRLAGVSASVNGVLAPLYYVSPGQVNLQVPYEAPVGPAILAINNNGLVATYRFKIQAAAPGATQYLWPAGSVTPITAASPGQSLVTFMTGEGDVLPYVATGNPPAGAALTQPPAPRLDFTMTVGGAAVTPQFVGIPSWSIGVTQVNFAVPAKLAPGVYPVVFTVGGVPSAPLKLTVGAASANVLVTFIPPSVNQASDGGWHYKTQLTETGGAGVNLTKLMVFGKDYTSQLSAWFGATRVPANGTISGSFVATCTTCSPPWDGTWQVSGTDDNGNTNTWSGTVHFLPASTSGTANAAKGKPMFKGSSAANAVAFRSSNRH